MRLVIPGRIPSKKNSRNIFRRDGRIFNIPSKEYERWHQNAGLHLLGKKAHDDVKMVELRFFMPDIRKTDLTNKAESIMDLLVDSKILFNDSWQCVPEIHLIAEGVDRKNPRVEIRII